MSYENVVEFVDLLAEADLVKFANSTPSVSQAREDVARARRIVQDIRPELEAAKGRIAEHAERDSPQ